MNKDETIKKWNPNFFFSQASLIHSSLFTQITIIVHGKAPLTATHHHRSWQSTLPHPLVSPHEKSPSPFTAKPSSSFAAKHSSRRHTIIVHGKSLLSSLFLMLSPPHGKTTLFLSPSSVTSSRQSTVFVSSSRQAALFPSFSLQTLSKQNRAFFQLVFFFFYFSCIFSANNK